MLHPYITEKSAARMTQNSYVFLIDHDANKKTVAAELKEFFNVTPKSVRIVNLPAKKVRFRQKPGERSIKRKAYVQLPAGQKIPGFESLTETKEKKAKTEAKKENS